MNLTLSKRRAEAVAGIGTVVIACLYILGFGVTLLHYAKFGIVSLSLLRAQYILVGFYLVLPLAGFLALTNLGLFAISTYDMAVRKNPSRQRLHKLIKLLLILLIATVLGCWWYFRWLEHTWFATALHITTDFQLYWLICLFCFVVWKVIPKTGSRDVLLIYTTGRLLCLVVGLASFFRYLVLFSVEAFPLIPQQYGGGAPTMIRLIFSKAAKEETATVALDARLQDRTVPYQLIFEDAESYFLIEPNDVKVMRLKKSLFVGYELLDAVVRRTSVEMIARQPEKEKKQPVNIAPSSPSVTIPLTATSPSSDVRASVTANPDTSQKRHP